MAKRPSSEVDTNKSKEKSGTNVNGVNKRSKTDKSNISKETGGKYEKTLARDGKKKDIKSAREDLKNGSTEKPNWLEFKKKKKELKEKYKAKRLTNIYDISLQVKQIGEKLRRSDTTKLDRKQLTTKAHDLLKNNYNRVILTHDLSRVVQWMFKYSEADLRQAIFNELKSCLSSMIESKYAKNCIKTMLKYGSQEMKREIVSACYGNVVKLVSHSVSAPLLEIIYSTHASEKEKRFLKQEFYGDMYKQAKDTNIRTLSDAYKTAEDMKTATLSAVKGNLMRILNKKLLNCTLVHCILLEFLENCTTEDRTEIIAMLRSSIVELSQTKFGSKVAVICIWHGTSKDRKFIMKSMKDNVKNISMSDHGYLILLALFDSVDDTVLIRKIILSEILNDLTDIALNDNGKHVILYLIARRNSHYFPPDIVKYLEQGDSNAASKKPADIREKELRDSVSEPLIEAVTTNTSVWMSNSSIAMVTLAILKIGNGEKLIKAFHAVATFVTDLKSKITEGGNEHKLVEHAGLHMMLKKLIQNDKELQEKGEPTFGAILDNYLKADVIKEWIGCNRGCFLLIVLLENEMTSTVESIVSKLKPMKKILKLKIIPGAKILLEKLK